VAVPGRSRAELVLSLGVLALGIGASAIAFTLPVAGGYARVGPNFMPEYVSIGIVVLGVWLLAEVFTGGWRDAVPEDPAARGEHAFALAAFAWVSAGLFLQMALIHTAGFVLAAAALYGCVARGFGSARVARDLGIGVTQVAGSGRNGVVRRSDVEAFARAKTSAPAAAPAPTSAPKTPAAPISIAAGERETRTPFRGVRRKIAEAMVRSKFTAPHFTVVEEVDVTDLLKLRESAKAFGAEQGVKVTIMPFIMKATALALAKYPMLNGHLDEAAQELVRYSYVNLGIAMDTEQGLIVPVVKEVQAKGILQIATELNELAERTRAGKVKPDELKGSTFSITNAGSIGGTLATPIINFPDIAILGVHRIMKKPGVVETPQGDKIEVRQYMNFSCSVDHRLADGADGARFLVYLKKLLENPGLLAM